MNPSLLAELRREGIVHSPEASISSLDDYLPNQVRLLRNCISPSGPPSSTPSPVPISLLISNVWTVGPQPYSADAKGSESSPLLLHTVVVKTAHSPLWGFSSNNCVSALTRLISLPEFGEQKVGGNGEGAEDCVVRSSSKSRDDINRIVPFIHLVSGSNNGGVLQKQCPLSTFVPFTRHMEIIGKTKLSDMVIHPPASRQASYSPLLPNSRQLKMRITNMPFNLSSRVSLLKLRIRSDITILRYNQVSMIC